jgi:Carbohydrate esterase, sialic acid-specific acetylesterase/Invasin, domain 3
MKTPPRSPGLRSLTLALAVAAAFMTETAPAQTINVNFAGANTANEPSASLSGPAGGLGTTWNQVVGTGASGTLLDSTGASTSVTVGHTYNLTADDNPTTLPILQASVANFGKGSAATVTISGLANAGIYDIWLVSLRNQPFGGDGSEQYHGNWITSNATSSPSSQLLDAVDPTINTTTFVAGYNYVLFEDVVATAGGVITFTADASDAGVVSAAGNRLGLNGMQIQKQTPPVVGIVDNAMSTVEASPATVFANGVLTSTVTVTLKDANGTAVPNKNVTLANTSGPQAATISPLTAVTTNGAGQAVFNVSSSTPGIEVFTATDVTDTLTLTDTASVEFLQVGVLTDASQSTVVASPTSVLANGSATSTITVTLRDANGFTVSGKSVALANSGGVQDATISPAGAVVSDANGQAVFSVSSSTIGAEQFTATDTTDSIALTQIANVNFIAAIAPKLINVNFIGGGDSPVQSTLSGPAGGLNTTWNSVAAVNTGALNDSTGAATTVTVGTDYANVSLGQDTFGRPNGNTVTINGLESGGIYDIWILSYRDITTASTTERNVGTWTTSNTTTSPSSQSVNSQTGSPGGTAFQAGYNYVLFENVVATLGGVISFTALGNGAGMAQDENSRRIHLNGLQIQDAAPIIAGPVADATSTVTATPAAVVANGVSAATVKVTLRDANGVPVSNKQVTLANTGGLTPPGALTTNAQGEAGFAVSSSTPGTVVFTATVVADNLTLTDTASVEFTDPEAPVAFNVNFHAGSPATGLLGVIGGSGETWNQGTTSASNLTDTTGTVASSVNVTGLPDGQDTVNAALNVFDANRNFFGKGADTTISITGLVPDTAYDLYIYALSHNQASWGNSTDSERAAGDFVTSNTVLGNGQSQWLDNGKAGTNGDNFVANGNYIVFQSIVSNGSGNISILVDAYDGLNGTPGDGDGDCRLHINGLQIRPASGMSIDYMNWRSASYPGLGLPDEDDDGDGLNNNFEYSFGLNPTSGASASPFIETLGLGNGFFRYTRRAKSLINMDYKVWYSTDLENWSEDNAASQIVESASNGVELVGVDIDPELLGENKLFIQIRTTPITGLDSDPALINLWGSGNTITLLFSKPMNPSSGNNPHNYTVTQDGAGTLNITTAVLSPDGGSVTLTLASALGADTPYTVNLDRLTSASGQALGNNITRQFRTWDDDPNGIKVFILAGQSNMVGYGNVETGATGAGTIGSLRYLAVNDASFPQYNYASLLTNPANTASAFRTRSDAKVWWRDGGANLGGTVRKGDLGPPFKGADDGKIGPEFAFGQVLGDFYPANDVLLIKCAWGGKDLAQQFRPPSAVARVPGTQVGPFFSAIIDDARDVLGNLGTQFPEWSGQGYQIVGFAWHQGFNDRINTAFSNEYKNNMPDFISDIRKAFNKPNLPFVIGSTGMDIGSPQAPPYSGYSAVEKAQLWVAGVTKPANVLSSDTRPFWRDAAVSPANQGYHWNWNAESYFLIGKTLGDDMVDLLTP